MAEYLLRLEGVNLSSFLDDTKDLSTIRGGGLLLLQAVEEVGKHHFNRPGQVISTGASSGLFRFPADDGGKAKAAEVDDFLKKSPLYRHATFVVDVEPMRDEADFQRAREAVLASNRLRQMRRPSLAMPSGSGAVCSVDAIRPASHATHDQDGKSTRISESVRQRREHGLAQKRGEFYRGQLGELAAAQDLAFLEAATFANHFAAIAGNPDMGNLHNKMAVLYLDGNAFGDKQTRCKTPDDLSQFDAVVKSQRRQFLHDLLKESVWETPIRLETLLWGGDEMMFVVPAWRGWWLLDRFFSQSRDWKVRVDGKEEALHHAAGLVFCHHNAPIARIKHLSMGLADLVKTSLGPDKSRHSGCAYLTLESFDSVGLDLGRYLENGLLNRTGVDAGGWMLAPESVATWLAAFESGLGDRLAKRQVYRAAKALTEHGETVEKLGDLLEEENETDIATLQTLRDTLAEPARPLFALHLALLWDYLACYQAKNQGSR